MFVGSATPSVGTATRLATQTVLTVQPTISRLKGPQLLVWTSVEQGGIKMGHCVPSAMALVMSAQEETLRITARAVILGSTFSLMAAVLSILVLPSTSRT